MKISSCVFNKQDEGKGGHPVVFCTCVSATTRCVDPYVIALWTETVVVVVGRAGKYGTG